MFEIFTYCVGLWFVFYLLNHAEITRPFVRPLVEKTKVALGRLAYPLECALCFTFHVTLVYWVFVPIPFYYVYVAPVINLFIELLFQKLHANRL